MRRRPGLCPGPRCGSSQHSPDLLARLRALVLKGAEGRGGKVKGERERDEWGGEGEGREEEGKWYPPLSGEKYAPDHHLQSLTFKFDLPSVNMNQCANNLGQL